MITNFKIFKSKKEFILLVGPPGSGKSTFIKKLQKNNKYDVINRDDVVTEVAERNGITYKEMFSKPNQVFLKTGKIFNPDDSDFYVENGKKYLKDFEHFGEIVDVEPNEYLSKFSPTKFKKLYELNVEVENTIDKNLEYLIRKKHNIIIDMTNNNEYNRKQIIGKLKSNRQYYKVIAAVFNNGGQGMEDLLIKINRLRDIPLAKIGRDKAISDETIKRFVNSYEPPTKSEGIDKITFIDTKTRLEKLIKENNSEYLKLQRGQLGDVKSCWDFNISNGQHGEGIYAFLYNDKPMIEYYTKRGEDLHTFQIPKKYVLDLSNKKYDYWNAKKIIFDNPQYKAFIFKHCGFGIPTSKEILITDPNIIEIN